MNYLRVSWACCVIPAQHGWSSEMGIFSGLRGRQGLFPLGCRIPVEHPQTLLLVQNQLRGGFVLDFLSG